MAKYTLTVVDTTNIQSYLFATNSLRQNAGASYLVDCATRNWVKDIFELQAIRHNILDIDSVEKPFSDQTIESDGLEAEVIYAGGGNTFIIFAKSTLAVEFAAGLTKKVMLKAPGLEPVVSHHRDFDWDHDALGGEEGVARKTVEQLARRKQARTVHPPTLGLGVSSRCVFTDLPAVAYDKDNRPVSAESWAKDVYEYDPKEPQATAYGRLRKLIDFGTYKPARDFDDLGASHGESSFMAVVHADGNQMNQRILKLSNRYAGAGKNRAYIGAMRGFSISVRRAGIEALNATVDLLIRSVNEIEIVDQKGTTREVPTIGERVVLAYDEKDETWILPFRPIVFGGDDITFVCDGRLGLSLAAYYLQQFTLHLLADGEGELADGDNAYCRAGIAIVHTHHPFAQAYQLAEELCASARRYVRDSEHIGSGVTAMDWHVAVGGAAQSIDEIRRREYTSDIGLKELSAGSGERAGDLLMRPLRISQPDWDWRSWDTFKYLTLEFRDAEVWRNRRNKVKALRSALRKGSAAVEQFRLFFLNDDPLPKIPELMDMEELGWQGQTCGYFDALEAVDLFVDLNDAMIETVEGGEL